MTKSFWNVIAVVLPFAAAGIAWMWSRGIASGTGDYGGRLAVGLFLILGIGAGCLLGAVAALVALLRGEARVWLSILGLVVNLAVVVPVARLLLKD